MGEVFDLDAVAAESTKTPFRFTFGGEEYELPPVMDLRIVTSLVSGQMDDAMHRLLGAEQWRRLQASPAMFTNERFTALLNAYMAHTGTDMGEASASTSS